MSSLTLWFGCLALLLMGASLMLGGGRAPP